MFYINIIKHILHYFTFVAYLKVVTGQCIGFTKILEHTYNVTIYRLIILFRPSKDPYRLF